MKNLKAFGIRLKRGLRQLWFRDIWHLWPSAPMNWRYVLTGQSDAVRLHRQLWWHSRYKLPGFLWLPLESLRWAHWRSWASSRRVDKAVAQYGDEVAARFGIPIAEQKRRVAYWAKAWCIDPYTAYDWQLYRPELDGLALVYDSQISAYHALQNRRTGAVKADQRLLSDKIALAEILAKQGVPMVETARVSRGDWQDIEIALMLCQKVFCKLRSGNQGESAFAVWYGDNGMQGLAHDGSRLPDEDAVRKAWGVLSGKGDVLIQPFLANHPVLAPVTADDVAITLRVVTRVGPEGIYVWWAELQVPGEVPLIGNRGFWRFPVSVSQGAVSALDREWFLRQAWQNEYTKLWLGISLAERVPNWEQISSYSLNAHQALPKVWAIAWDWVITPNGPVLLEGNSGWGLCEVQQQGVDLLLLSLNGPQGSQ